MKIEKLYTLSQFVDLIKSDINIGNKESFLNVIYYNEFLKQPLKKEMFVNELEKPTWDKVKAMPLTSEGVDSKYWVLIKAWQEAEKKVIFKNLKYHDLQPSTRSNYWSLNGVKVMQEFNTGYFALDMTLHNLAEATNGELELQNVEL